MKYRPIGTDMNRNFRNDINQNFEDIDADIKRSALASDTAKTNSEQALSKSSEAIVMARDAKTTANSISGIASEAKTIAETSKATADDAKTTAKTVRGEFDQVVAEAGSNNPEVVNARGEFATLKQRIDSITQIGSEEKTYNYSLSLEGGRMMFIMEEVAQ